MQRLHGQVFNGPNSVQKHQPFFQNKFIVFFGCFDAVSAFFVCNKIKYIQGDLSDVSAEIAVLVRCM